MAIAANQRERLEQRFRLWDTDGDGRVEREEFEADERFSAVCTEHILEKGDAGFAEVVRPTIRAIVDLCDTDGDGQVNPEEFKRWTDAIEVDRSKADSVAEDTRAPLNRLLWRLSAPSRGAS
jgi:Ca2+-binding EF-hand superfamily protein